MHEYAGVFFTVAFSDFRDHTKVAANATTFVNQVWIYCGYLSGYGVGVAVLVGVREMPTSFD